MTATPTEDRDEIGAVLRLYTRALDRGDLAALERVFLPGAKIEYHLPGVPSFEYPGVLSFLETTLTSHKATHHVLSNMEVELRGDEASAETYLTATHVQVDREGASHLMVLGGVYHDELVRSEAGWRIRARELETLYIHGPTLPPDRVQRFPLPRGRGGGA